MKQGKWAGDEQKQDRGRSAWRWKGGLGKVKARGRGEGGGGGTEEGVQEVQLSEVRLNVGLGETGNGSHTYKAERRK